MVTERQIRETVAQCTSCLDFYVNSGKTRPGKAVMIAELRATADLVTQWGLGASAIRDSLLRPVQDVMIARYGAVEGRNLARECVEAFTSTG